jgi:hypothetical protein
MAWYAWLLLASGAVTAFGTLDKSPVGRSIRWVMRQLVSGPLSRSVTRLVHDAVRPMVDEVKENARQQHDEQNHSLQTIKSTLAQHGQRLVLIEDHITRPKG